VQEYSLTLPAWYLVARASIQTDAATGAQSLKSPTSFVTIEGSAGPVVPMFSSEALANQFVSDNKLPAVVLRVETPAQLIELLEHRVPPDTTMITFDPAPGNPGAHVTREEALRVTRGG
jgi:hypothetical protein